MAGRIYAERLGTRPEQLQSMERDLGPHTKSVIKYKTIRDKIYAHSAMDPNSSFALYKDAKIAEVDELIHFLHDLVCALRKLWDEGVQPATLGADDYNYKTVQVAWAIVGMHTRRILSILFFTKFPSSL